MLLFFQKLARFTVFCMFTLPVIVAIALTVEEDGTPSMNICMGKTEVNFLNFNRGFVCKSKNWLENVLCNIILYTYIITSCNIIEVFFMWSTYQHIKESTESAKALIGRQHYQKRKKYSIIILKISDFCDSLTKFSFFQRRRIGLHHYNCSMGSWSITYDFYNHLHVASIWQKWNCGSLFCQF